MTVVKMRASGVLVQGNMRCESRIGTVAWVNWHWLTSALAGRTVPPSLLGGRAQTTPGFIDCPLTSPAAPKALRFRILAARIDTTIVLPHSEEVSTTPQHTQYVDRTSAKLRLPASQAEHKGAILLVHHTRPQAGADAQRAQQ